MKKYRIFIISGPSGAGEDSIINGLSGHIAFEKIITTTTREMRPGEVDGKNYYFLSPKLFKQGIEKDEFYEFAEEDRGNYYGVTKKEIDRVFALGVPIIWKVDYKGVITAKKIMPDCVTILLDVPLDVIEKRIRKRDNASEDYIKERLEYAKGWFENRDKFDYSIKNQEGKLNEAIKEVAEIIKKNS